MSTCTRGLMLIYSTCTRVLTLRIDWDWACRIPVPTHIRAYTCAQVQKGDIDLFVFTFFLFLDWKAVPIRVRRSRSAISAYFFFFGQAVPIRVRRSRSVISACWEQPPRIPTARWWRRWIFSRGEESDRTGPSAPFTKRVFRSTSSLSTNCRSSWYVL